jgi:phage shock protein A
VGYQLRMSGEIHDWLTGLRAADPSRASLVAEALTALAAGGASLGPPLVHPADPGHPQPEPPELDPRERLDLAYQDWLEQLTALRRRVADAATLARQFSTQIDELGALRAQLAGQRQEALAAGDTSRAGAVQQAIADVDGQVATLRERLPQVTAAEQALARQSAQAARRVEALRVRKETLKARYTAAEGKRRVAEATAVLEAEPGDAAAAEAKLQEITGEIERELGQGVPPAGAGGTAVLLELRPEAETSILFAVEPPGTALLIAVLDGGDAIRDHRDDAVTAAREVLRQAQAGQDPQLAARGYPDARSVLAEFGPVSA